MFTNVILDPISREMVARAINIVFTLHFHKGVLGIAVISMAICNLVIFFHFNVSNATYNLIAMLKYFIDFISSSNNNY